MLLVINLSLDNPTGMCEYAQATHTCIFGLIDIYHLIYDSVML